MGAVDTSGGDTGCGYTGWGWGHGEETSGLRIPGVETLIGAGDAETGHTGWIWGHREWK